MKYFLPLVIPYETAFAKDRADVEHRALLGGSWLLFVCGCVTFVLSSSYIHIQLELVRSSNISEQFFNGHLLRTFVENRQIFNWNEKKLFVSEHITDTFRKRYLTQIIA